MFWTWTCEFAGGFASVCGGNHCLSMCYGIRVRDWSLNTHKFTFDSWSDSWPECCCPWLGPAWVGLEKCTCWVTLVRRLCVKSISLTDDWTLPVAYTHRYGYDCGNILLPVVCWVVGRLCLSLKSLSVKSESLIIIQHWHILLTNP